MSTINDGGPAFPVEFDHHTFNPHDMAEAKRLMSGMSLRDYFAGMALQGWLASFGSDDSPKPKNVAAFAYEVADEMLAQREKGGAA